MTTALIGMLGGMSWQSTELYHRALNVAAEARLGPHRNARTLIHSFAYADLLAAAERDDWSAIADAFATAAQGLETAGAQLLLISAVTGHLVADRVAERIAIPLLHIADPTGQALADAGHRKVALLGTRFTMESDVVAGRLRDRYRIDILVPEAEDRAALHAIITGELTRGIVTEPARRTVQALGRAMRDRGADAIAVACTELPLLMPATADPLPTFDMAQRHAEQAIVEAIRLGHYPD